MKKISLLVATAVIACVGIVTQSNDASAEPAGAGAVRAQGPVAQVQTPVLFQFTRVSGTINVSGAPLPGAPLNGWNCDDLAVSVASQESIQPAGGGFAYPKWQKSAKASGNWASGTCSYSITVVPNSAFTVGVSSSSKDYPCDYIQGLTFTPWYSPAITVPKGQTKAQNFVATGTAKCGHIN